MQGANRVWKFIAGVVLVLGGVVVVGVVMERRGEIRHRELEVADMPPGLAAWWSFEEDSGEAVLDRSGNDGHGGMLEGANGLPLRVAGGVFGKGLQFDGVDDAARFSNLGLGGDLTVEFWVKAPVQGWNGRMIELSSNNQRGLQLTLEPSGQVSVNDAGGPGRGIASMPHVPRLDDDRWHHFVVTRQGDEYRLYIDGLWVGVDWGTHPAYDAVTLAALITDSGFFKGVIDDVAIYNRALKEDEVRRSCRRSLPLEGGGQGGGGCPDVRAPIITSPAPGVVLPATQAFVAWRGEVDAEGTSVAKGVGGYHFFGDIDGINNNGTISLNEEDLVARDPSTTIAPTYTILDIADVNYVGRWRQVRLRPLVDPDGDGPLPAVEIPSFESSRLFSTEAVSSLLALWHLEETGTIVVDATGNGHGGTSHNIIAGVAGVSGNAHQFDNRDPSFLSYDSFGDDPGVFDGRSALTVEAWVRPTALETNRGLVAKNASYELRTWGGGGQVLWSTATANGDVNSLSTTSMVVGRWYHVVGSYDGVRQRLFINGVLEASDGQRGAVLDYDHHFCLGFLCTGGDAAVGTGFSGLIDEAAVYDRALSPAVVLSHYCGVEVLGGRTLPNVCVR